jgi:uncharacterized membrane-anchored protein
MQPESTLDPQADAGIPRWINRSADWFKGHARQILFAAVLGQLAVLLGMIVLHLTPLLVGERILLHVRPVDPRDIFRGDYVVLAYDFSQPPPGAIPGAPAPPSWRNDYRRDSAWIDRTVYVRLEPEPDGRHYKAAGYSLERPSSGRYLKGRMVPSWNGNVLQCGIEAFYVEEGKGRVLEDRRNQGNLSAEVALAPWGQAVLCDVK